MVILPLFFVHAKLRPSKSTWDHAGRNDIFRCNALRIVQHDMVCLSGKQIEVLIGKPTGSLQIKVNSMGIAIGSNVKFQRVPIRYHIGYG